MSGTTAYPLQPAYYAPNGIGQFKIGVSPLGTRPSLNLWDTILSQYANSPTITQMLANMQQYLDPTGNIDDFYDDIWNIQTAQGYGLDVWGRIVGVNRILQVSNTAYFGFIGPSGESGLPFNQGVFYNGEPVTSNYALTDDAFRVLILTKALFNVCDGSVPAINQILLFLFGPSGKRFPDHGQQLCSRWRQHDDAIHVRIATDALTKLNHLSVRRAAGAIRHDSNGGGQQWMSRQSPISSRMCGARLRRPDTSRRRSRRPRAGLRRRSSRAFRRSRQPILALAVFRRALRISMGF